MIHKFNHFKPGAKLKDPVPMGQFSYLEVFRCFIFLTFWYNFGGNAE